MTMPVLDIFGYDDAVAGRTRLVSDSPRWAQDMRSEFADADRAGDVTTVWRSAAAKGIELEPKQIAGMKNWNGLRERAMKSEKALLKEAPLVYVTPGVATRLAEYSSVVPDVHVLPFAEPVILWFATALEGDWEPT